jgi:isomaltose glucohydrolase
VMAATVEKIEAELVSGGVHRYLDDVYYGGGEWVLLAGFLGWYHAETGRLPRASQLLDWMVEQADEAGNLPEQVSHHLLHPECYQEWVERWGDVARPLLWSHAMFLNLQRELRSAT